MNKFYVEKYNPKKLEELTHNPKVSQTIKNLSEKTDFPHLVFYGPEGSGKKTRINILLKLIFGDSVFNKTTIENKELKYNSKSIIYSIASSKYHIELTPSDNGFYDKVIIQSVIRDLANTSNVSVVSDANLKFKSKILIIKEADKLTREAQSALRRTMEKYVKNCRIIMICNYISKIMAPIRSRCVAIRVAAPSLSEIKEFINYVISKEKINVKEEQVNQIIQLSNRNINKAIGTLQLTALEKENSKKCYVPEYIENINTIGDSIIKEQSAEKVKMLRESIVHLLVNGIPGGYVIKFLMEYIIKRDFSEESKRQIVYWASFYEKRCNLGNKELIHLEAFVIKAMYHISLSKC